MKKNFKCSIMTAKPAFTLAEVLITLAIIGVVAALTIPNLVYSYKKRTIETRLAHFSSLWQQAFRMAEVENGSSYYWDALPADAPDAMYESYNKYLDKYIKTNRCDKTPKGLACALANGSGFHLRKNYLPAWTNCAGWRGCLYLTFCVHYEKCKSIQDEVDTTAYGDGKELFSFNEIGRVPIARGNIYYTRESAKTDCAGDHYACSTLIQMDGWKIADDYPIKL